MAAKGGHIDFMFLGHPPGHWIRCWDWDQERWVSILHYVLYILHRDRNREAFLPPANEVWGKVICLHLFVILFTGKVPGPRGCLLPGGGGAPAPRGRCLLLGGVCSRGSAPGGCLLPGGSAPVGVPAPRGVCSWRGGACSRGGAWWRPPRTTTAAGGTHPTAVHSCFLLCPSRSLSCSRSRAVCMSHNRDL